MVTPLTFKGDKKVKKRKHHKHRDTDEAHKKKALQIAEAAVGADAVADDDSWVSAETLGDVAGPVMLVLPSTPPTALACDANGKVFALPIENIVDGNPASAEPHDVRQVWVANRIVGTEHFRFKGHHERYLGCDKYGLLSATSIAVSPLESFVLVEGGPAAPETFQIKTLRDTYLSVQPAAAPGAGGGGSGGGSRADAVPDVRGDATAPAADGSTALRIRMQARFKPRVRAAKEDKAREKISRRELEDAAGRRLEDDEIRLLKRARRDGDYHEKLLDVKMRYKHDKFG